MTSDFTIAFICHGEYELYSKTIEQNIKALCSNTKETYDLMLIIDGAEKIDAQPVIQLARKLEINEIRFRNRNSNCADGDPSNNGHIHLFSDKTPFLVTFESDVVLFNLNEKFDFLAHIKEEFTKNEDLCLATKIDDFECWVWELKEDEIGFSNSLPSVNRVSSHFLIYHTLRCRKYLVHENYSYDLFYDNNKDEWYNYEDLLSGVFSKPNGPGIGFFKNTPIKVYHCDRKESLNSPFYTKNSTLKIEEFYKRKNEIELEIDFGRRNNIDA